MVLTRANVHAIVADLIGDACVDSIYVEGRMPQWSLGSCAGRWEVPIRRGRRMSDIMFCHEVLMAHVRGDTSATAILRRDIDIALRCLDAPGISHAEIKDGEVIWFGDGISRPSKREFVL